jgi:mono/diheme cytochrome c family protein
MGMAVWDALFLDHTRHPPDPAKSGQWNRGADLVNGLGHCGGCHTPKNILFADKKDELFQGSRARPSTAGMRPISPARCAMASASGAPPISPSI